MEQYCTQELVTGEISTVRRRSSHFLSAIITSADFLSTAHPRLLVDADVVVGLANQCALAIYKRYKQSALFQYTTD